MGGLGAPLYTVMLGRASVSSEAAVAATLTNLYPRPWAWPGPTALGCSRLPLAVTSLQPPGHYRSSGLTQHITHGVTSLAGCHYKHGLTARQCPPSGGLVSATWLARARPSGRCQGLVRTLEAAGSALSGGRCVAVAGLQSHHTSPATGCTSTCRGVLA